MLDIPKNCEPDTSSVPVNTHSFTFLETTPAEVYKVLSTLKKNKASGCDNIPAVLLKFCAAGIANSLTCLFNRSFELSQFPSAWKEALVVPVFKKGSRTDPGNYRPIALLPIVSKVLERVVHHKLTSFLQPWLHERQSGFKKGDGTVPQLLRLCQEWSKLIDSTTYVGALFFDLKKAFDRVWHPGLLAKLEAAGIRGSALAWIKSFLTARRHTTIIDGCTSLFEEIEAGVPQGAILSPLLFSVYVNDLPSAAPGCDVNLFADDTSAYVSSPSPTQLNKDLQTAANSLSAWFDRWHLTIHPGKTVSMALRSTKMMPCRLSIKIGDSPICQVNEHRHLGVMFSETLSWKSHIHTVVNKAAQKFGLLRRLGRRLSSTVLQDLYVTCIRPSLEYASIVWSGLRSNDASRLERCNRSAARLISRTSPSSDIPHQLLLSRAGLPELRTRRRIAQCLFIRKAFRRRHPQHLQRSLLSWLPTGKQRKSPRTSQFYVRTQRPRKSIFQRSPVFHAVSTWNSFIASQSHAAGTSLPTPKNILNFHLTSG